MPLCTFINASNAIGLVIGRILLASIQAFMRGTADQYYFVAIQVPVFVELFIGLRLWRKS